MMSYTTERMYDDSALRISGAVIDGDYRDYPQGGFSTSEGEIICVDDSHEYIQLALEDVVQIEVQGALDYPMIMDTYLVKYHAEIPWFGAKV